MAAFTIPNWYHPTNINTTLYMSHNIQTVCWVVRLSKKERTKKERENKIKDFYNKLLNKYNI